MSQSKRVALQRFTLESLQGKYRVSITPGAGKGSHRRATTGFGQKAQAMLVSHHAQFVRRLLLLAVIFPGLYLASIIASVVQDYRSTLRSADSDARRISTALSEHANRAIGEADRLMLNAAAEIEDNELVISSENEQALHRLLKSYSNALPQFLAINAVDAQGQVIASGLRAPVARTSVSDRDYFQYHRSTGSSGFYISRAVKSRTSGQWVFTISRSIRNKDGSLRLVLVTGMSIAYFEGFYRSLNPGANSRLLLVRRDGWVLVESPLMETALDKNIASALLFEHFRKSPSGAYEVESGAVDQTPRIISYTDSPTYPFLSVASLSREEVLRPWSRRMRQSLAWGIVSTGLMLLMIAMLRRQFSSLLSVQADLENKNKGLARSERRYQELVDGIEGIVWEADYPRLRFTYVSKSAEKISGHPAEEWRRDEMFWENRLNSSREDVLSAVRLSSNNSRGPFPLEHCLHVPGKGETWLLNNVTVSETEGSITLRGIMVDNTERKRAYQELELAAKVFENSLLAIIIVGCDGRILRVNKAFVDMMGYPEDQLVGAQTTSIPHDFNQPTLARTVKTSLQGTGKWQGEAHARTRSGHELVLLNSMSIVRDESGAPSAVIVICKDITEQRASERLLYQMAHFDHLTNLPNRQTFADRIQHAINIAERQQNHLALMFLDLDHFKTINDSLGHAIGDEVLRVVADRINTCLRMSDTVARVGGDEFVVLLEEIDRDPDTIQNISRKLCSAISESIRINELELYVALSIGISVFPQDGRDAETLMRNADTAMYRAKLSGRSCWRFFNEDMARSTARRLELRMALRHAIERGEMELYYQPQRCLHTGVIIGVEALIRWNRPGLGAVSPQEFIPICEESSLIIQIGNWALLRACEQASSWLREKNLRLRVGVNITAKQILHDGFVKQVSDILERTGLPPELLELEITEGSILENIDETVTKLTRLKALGVTVAIDDFGTGYSSLSYLTQLPIDRLKIDQSFVRDTPADLHDCAIIRTIIAMSANLGLSVIAEGVESNEQSDFLSAEGCDEIQGYLLSRPRPAEAIAEIL